MRNLYSLDQYRLTGPEVMQLWGWTGDHGNGAFLIPSPIDGGALKVIASDQGEWDHVSVSRVNRCPNWPEMEFVKRTFFRDNETAMQLHVPPEDHVNVHPHCLHLWRPQGREIPRPPGWFVGYGKDRAADLAAIKRFEETGKL